MMELMQGYVNEGTNVGVDEPDRWSLEAISFLSETTTALSAEDLLQVS
jgi:hypothetical protein